MGLIADEMLKKKNRPNRYLGAHPYGTKNYRNKYQISIQHQSRAYGIRNLDHRKREIGTQAKNSGEFSRGIQTRLVVGQQPSSDRLVHLLDLLGTVALCHRESSLCPSWASGLSS